MAAPLAPALASVAGLAAALAAVGVLGLFGSDDGDDRGAGGEETVEALAARLDVRPEPDAVAARLDDLLDATETLADAAAADGRVPVGRGDDPVAQASALARAVERGDATVTAPEAGRGAQATSPTGDLADAADRVERRQSPASSAARDLLAAVREGRDAERALADAVAALDEHHAVADAVGAVPPTAADADDRLRRRLDAEDGDLAAGVRSLADALGTARRRAADVEAERKDLADAVERVGAAAARATDAAVDPAGEGTTVERARALVDAVESGAIAFGDADGEVADAAARVRRRTAPESGTAGRLLDALASPGGADDLVGPLDAAVSALDRGATDRSVVGDVDAGAVDDLAVDVADRLAGRDGPVADELRRRVAELRASLDRADDANAVVPYAVRQELRFYDRALLEALDGSVGGAGGEAGGTGPVSRPDAGLPDVDARLAEVADRVGRAEAEFVDGRPDHNHSIPLHFLELADRLHGTAADRVAAGEPRAALGLLDAADELLDAVAALYERNEYSVLLRRLRG